jgi:hypothetical protein
VAAGSSPLNVVMFLHTAARLGLRAVQIFQCRPTRSRAGTILSTV